MVNLKALSQQTKITLVVILGIILVASVILTGFLIQSTKIADNSKAAVNGLVVGSDKTVVNAASGSSFSLTFNVSSSLPVITGEGYVGYQLKYAFDNTKLQLTGIQYLMGQVSTGLGTDASNLTTANTNGTVKAYGEIPGGSIVTINTNTQTVVTLTFQVKATGQSFISFATVNPNTIFVYKKSAGLLSPVTATIAANVSVNPAATTTTVPVTTSPVTTLPITTTVAKTTIPVITTTPLPTTTRIIQPTTTSPLPTTTIIPTTTIAITTSTFPIPVVTTTTRPPTTTTVRPTNTTAPTKIVTTNPTVPTTTIFSTSTTTEVPTTTSTTEELTTTTSVSDTPIVVNTNAPTSTSPSLVEVLIWTLIGLIALVFSAIGIVLVIKKRGVV